MSRPNGDTTHNAPRHERLERAPAAEYLTRVGQYVAAVADGAIAARQTPAAYTSRYGYEDVRGVQFGYPAAEGVLQYVGFGRSPDGIICLDWAKSEPAPWDFSAFRDVESGRLMLAVATGVRLLYIPAAIRATDRLHSIFSRHLGIPYFDAPVHDAPDWYCRADGGVVAVDTVLQHLADPTFAASQTGLSLQRAVERAQQGPVEEASPALAMEQLSVQAAAGVLERLPGILRECVAATGLRPFPGAAQ